MSEPTTSGHCDDGDHSGANDSSWPLLLAISALRRDGGLTDRAMGLWHAADDILCSGAPDDPRARLVWRGGRFTICGEPAAPTAAMLQLYLPMLGVGPGQSLVIGHLGQSIDAQIATRTGDSCYVTGREDLAHMHRMRALADAVLVGAGTVAADDPRLTTRLVEGPNPVRVVLDPERRLTANRRLFSDGQAPTLLICAANRTRRSDPQDSVLGVPTDDEGLSIDDIILGLRERGLRVLFIEGGGVTVSRWMTAGKLDRLQVATAPVLIGAGRPGLRLPAAASMRSCLRPPYRLFRMGQDLLWDFDLRDPGIDQGRADRAEEPPVWLL